VDIVRALRVVSIAEATSFLVLLLIAMPLKYAGDMPQAVSLVGPIHGVLFLALVALVLAGRGELGWDGRRTVLALIAAVLPLAPFFVERYWIRPVTERGPVDERV
jgi:integral membrane protein